MLCPILPFRWPEDRLNGSDWILASFHFKNAISAFIHCLSSRPEWAPVWSPLHKVDGGCSGETAIEPDWGELRAIFLCIGRRVLRQGAY